MGFAKKKLKNYHPRTKDYGSPPKILRSGTNKMSRKKRRRTWTNRDYHEYLDGPEWARVREAFFARNPRKCRKCGSQRDLHVHHRTYPHVFHELKHLADLTCLCGRCHRAEHQAGRVVNYDVDWRVKKAQRMTRILSAEELAERRRGVARYELLDEGGRTG